MALKHDYVVFSSGGNDSIALVQWMIEHGHTAYVVYSNTGWAQAAWAKRVERMFDWARSHGCTPVELGSEGMVSLVKRKKAWPRNQIQFCTRALKIEPALAWLSEIDPEKELECCVGIRRCESARRAQWPEHIEESDKHDGRSLWAPLVRHDDEARDALLLRGGWEPLPHRSMECFPCINANRTDLLLLPEERIAYIEGLEKEMGVSPKTNKPKTMFRPYRHLGGIGIREVVRWANAAHGKFVPEHYAAILEQARSVAHDKAQLRSFLSTQPTRVLKYLLKQFKADGGESYETLKAAVASLELTVAPSNEGPGEECDAGMCGM